MEVIRVGTRRSALARAQTTMVIAHLKNAQPQYDFSEEVILTSGDRKQGTAAASCGDKRDWIDVFEDYLLRNDLDLAVHCGKDIPVDIAQGLTVTSVLARESAQDVFIGKIQADGRRKKFSDLIDGEVVGTASCRRQAQLLRYNSNLKVKELRGNVNTRLAALDAERSEFAGIILAEAGIKRLALDLEYEVLDSDAFVPAVNQGILAIEYAQENEAVAQLLKRINQPSVEICFQAERLVIEILEADCKSAVGVYATINNQKFIIKAQVLASSGSEIVAASLTGDQSEALKLADQLANSLLARGAGKLLKEH